MQKRGQWLDLGVPSVGRPEDPVQSPVATPGAAQERSGPLSAEWVVLKRRVRLRWMELRWRDRWKSQNQD